MYDTEQFKAMVAFQHLDRDLRFSALQEKCRGKIPLHTSAKPSPLRRSAMSFSPNPKDNRLLAALPEAEWQRWQAQIEHVHLSLGAVLYESGGAMSHVYFPTTAIVSLLYVMEDGASAEIAVVGNEGIVGISLFMGGG